MSKLKSLNKFTVTNIKCYGMVIIAFAILYPMLQADMISNKISGLLIPICAYVVMAISLNLTVGFLGELSLGHAGFMSVGAFSGVITVACMQGGMPAPVKLLIAIIIGGIMAGILGLIIGIPVLGIEWLIGKISKKTMDYSSLRIVQWAFKVIVRLAGIELTVIGEENVPDEPVLFIGNHRSYFDIVITYARCKNLTGYIAKKEMLSIPLLRTWMKRLYCLFLDRENPKEGLKTILQAIDYVKHGVSICILP